MTPYFLNEARLNWNFLPVLIYSSPNIFHQLANKVGARFLSNSLPPHSYTHTVFRVCVWLRSVCECVVSYTVCWGWKNRAPGAGIYSTPDRKCIVFSIYKRTGCTFCSFSLHIVVPPSLSKQATPPHLMKKLEKLHSISNVEFIECVCMCSWSDLGSTMDEAQPAPMKKKIAPSATLMTFLSYTLLNSP